MARTRSSGSLANSLVGAVTRRSSGRHQIISLHFTSSNMLDGAVANQVLRPQIFRVSIFMPNTETGTQYATVFMIEAYMVSSAGYVG